MPRLYGNRIMLREYKKEDLEYIRKWVSISEITDCLSHNFIKPHTLEQSQEFLEMRLKNNEKDRINFVIADKETEEYIGQIDLLKVDYINRVGTLGIVLGSEENLSRGYGSEAINLLLKYSFERLNLNKIELTVHDYNERAQNCYKKCGFIEEGRIKENFYINGKYSDTIHMGIMKREFEELNK